MPKGVDQRELVEKVGGVFRLCALVQKRMRELVMGARPLVEVSLEERRDLLEIVKREIYEDKIGVAEEGEATVDLEGSDTVVGGLTDTIDLSELGSVVADTDLAIPLPGDEEPEEDEPTDEAEALGLNVVEEGSEDVHLADEDVAEVVLPEDLGDEEDAESNVEDGVESPEEDEEHEG